MRTAGARPVAAFDAAIVDIMMPGLNGIETLDELKRIDEDLAVLIITAMPLSKARSRR